MAKKLSDQMVKRMKTIGIKAKNEEEARKKLLEFLEKQGIEGMEEEDTDSLIEMAESFGDDEEVMDEAEKEAEELADEAEEEEEDEESEEEDENESEDDEVEEEVDDEEEKEIKKSAAKKENTKKVAAKKADVKKVAAKKTGRTRGVKLDPKNNKEDRKYFSVFHKLFPVDDYNYVWMSTNGVNIKNKGNNCNRSLILVESCTLKEIDGKEVVKCNMYFSILNHREEVLNNKDIEFENCWNGTPMIKGLTFEEVIETVEEVYDDITGLVNKVDKRLGENRKKMEDSLKKSTKKEIKSNKKSGK